MDEIERVINESLGKWSRRGKSSGKRITTPEQKVNILVNRAIEMEKDRRAIIAFNTANASSDPTNMIRWTDKTVLKSGKERVMTFTQVDDNVSLNRLIQSEYRVLLNNSLEGTEVNITTNVFKKYWVVIIDNKLVPLCRDFKGGLGREYLWTSDEDMVSRPPSTDWKNESKKKNDPRREMIDPVTMKPWVPEDEMVGEGQGSTEEEVSDRDDNDDSIDEGNNDDGDNDDNTDDSIDEGNNDDSINEGNNDDEGVGITSDDESPHKKARSD